MWEADTLPPQVRTGRARPNVAWGVEAQTTHMCTTCTGQDTNTCHRTRRSAHLQERPCKKGTTTQSRAYTTMHNPSPALHTAGTRPKQALNPGAMQDVSHTPSSQGPFSGAPGAAGGAVSCADPSRCKGPRQTLVEAPDSVWGGAADMHVVGWLSGKSAQAHNMFGAHATPCTGAPTSTRTAQATHGS